MYVLPDNEKIQKYLDELSNEYKELLFKALLERSKSLDDISISELLRIDNEVKKPLYIGYQRQQRQRKMLVYLGIIYIILGIFIYLIYSIKEFNFSADSIFLLTSLIISSVGLCAIAFSFILPTTKIGTYRATNNSKSETSKLLAYNVIAQWRELEGIVTDLAENNNVTTPRSVIEYLSSNNFIDKQESDTLREFLKLRNSIVHSSEITHSPDEINEVSNKVSKIIEKLNRIL